MATTEQIKAFIDKMGPLVVQVCQERGYGNPQLWTCICQAGLESGWATSARMTNAHAYFGIKATKSWVQKAKYGGLVYSAKTKECYDGKTYTDITDTFRAYNTDIDSIRDYFDLMESNRYKASLAASSVAECITIIRNSGYATSPTYISSIVNLYDTYKGFIEVWNVGNTTSPALNTTGTAQKKVIDLMTSWYGFNMADGTHKCIINLYNTYLPHPRGYEVKYTDAWCATALSAAFIGAGYADLCPIECSCNQMIAKAMKMGIWHEDESVTPEPGWIILYDWQDGEGYTSVDNVGTAEHVGLVVSVDNGIIKVIEGNKQKKVDYRNVAVNGRYIRGYIVPSYPSSIDPEVTVQEEDKGNAIYEVGGKYTLIRDMYLRTAPAGATVKSYMLPSTLKDKCLVTNSQDVALSRNTEITVEEIKQVDDAIWLKIYNSYYILGIQGNLIYVK